jgi:hypothetical protein
MVKTTLELRAPLALAWFLVLAGTPALAQEADKGPPALRAKPLEPAAGDSKLTRLLKERYNAALEDLQASVQLAWQGRQVFGFLLEAQTRCLEAGLELKDRRAERIALLKDHLELAKRVEQEINKRFQDGRVSVQDRARGRYLRLNVEIRLLREQQKARVGLRK